MRIPRDIKHKILAEKDSLSIQQIAKKYKIKPTDVKKIITSLPKKTPKWFYAVLILIPIVLVLGLEIFLKSIDYGYNFDQWVDAGQGKFKINPEIGRKYFPSGDFNPNTIEDVFDQQKQTNSFRVFVLGGSSAQGYPYNPMGSFSRYIRKRLELVYPKTKIEVVNISMTAVNSYTILDLLPGVLNQSPDLILIYAGHNEYYGAMGVGSVQSNGSIRKINQLVIYLNRYKITQLVRNTLQQIISLFASENSGSSGTLMSKMAKEKNIPLHSEIFYAGVQQFENNLKDVLEMIRDSSIPVIMGRLVCNLKDQKPFISIKSEDQRSADEVYREAQELYKNKNFNQAHILFSEAKELDVLRFRAPNKINQIIEDLGKEYQIPIVPFDSNFASVSDGGIVGDNLIVDHLHPNVEGYQLIGRGFYECMVKHNYIPLDEQASVKFSRQDSLTRANFVFTRLDTVLGNYYVKLLKSDWPYSKKRVAISEFKGKDFYNLFNPKNFIDSLAMIRIQNKVTWVEAHLIGATYNLRNDNVKEYLKYMNVLIYQYPNLRDLDFAIRYFYEQNKIKLEDFTPRRNGLMALYIGNYDNAIKHLREAFKLESDDPEVLYNLSLAYSKKEDFNSALKFINKCLIEDQKYPGARNLKQEILNQLN